MGKWVFDSVEDFSLTYRRDEIMYQAHLHPEQYSNTFTDEQIQRLHDAMMYVCDTAVAANGDSDEFPKDWLMKHRWGKGKKDANKLPNGDKITFLKVGGRTSAIVPSRQKKTAAVAGDVSDGTEDEDVEEDEPKPKKVTKKTTKTVQKKDEENAGVQERKVASKSKRGRSKIEMEEVKEESEEDEEPPVPKKQKTAPKSASKTKKAVKDEPKAEDTGAKRRSTRLSR